MDQIVLFISLSNTPSLPVQLENFKFVKAISVAGTSPNPGIISVTESTFGGAIN